LFVGDDWAEDHHDVEVQDRTGRRLGKARLPEGIAGIARLHELIAGFAGEDLRPEQVLIGIETDRGPWVTALVAAGYTVFAINPRQVARYRERHGTSGAKSDAGDAHVLADMVRTDAHQLRAVAGDSALVEGIKVAARAHQNLIWDRHRQLLRLRSALREYFPAALEAFDDLAAADALDLLGAAPDPERAARLSRSRIAAALRRARRRDVEAKAEKIQTLLRTEQLTQPPDLVAAYAATTAASVAVITAFTGQITALQGQVEAHFGRHPDVEIYRSQPGSVRSSAPGCSASSATTPTATTARGPAGTTPAAPRSPAPRGRRRSYSPGSCATSASPTPCISRPSARCAPHPAPGPTTTSCAPAVPGTTPRCASSATAWSASCTAA
jgi:transposase